MRLSAPGLNSPPTSPPPPAPSRFAQAGAITLDFTPTPEQAAIGEGFAQQQPIVVEALAGTGKTSTLRMLAASTNRQGVYLAYNKAIVREAEGRFPGTVQVGTAHSFAYRAVGHQFAHRIPGPNSTSRRLRASQLVSRLGARTLSVEGATISPVQVVRLAQATVDRYCLSGDLEVGPQHLPLRAHVLGPPEEVAPQVLPVARRIWADLSKPEGRLWFTHDHYLKLWQLQKPRLYADYILFDEAQDANPVIAAVVAAQDHAQPVYVGDQNQQLYAWRGAVDAMSKVGGRRYALTKSFRFGPAIAEAANGWLGVLGSPHRVVGHEPVRSVVGPLVGTPDAILCRTNGTALGLVLTFQALDIPVALAPGDRGAGKDILNFAYAARDLMAGKGTDHPELSVFEDWADLLKYVDEEEGGSDLGRMVNIINRIGPAKAIAAIKGLSPRERAQVTVSTAHKAKGLEWDRVRIADDFAPPDPDDPEATADPAELMLAYVSVTRAKLHLSPGPLADPSLWVRSASGTSQDDLQWRPGGLVPQGEQARRELGW